MVKLYLVFSFLTAATPIFALKARNPFDSAPKLKIDGDERHFSINNNKVNASLHITRDLTSLTLLPRQSTCATGTHECLTGEDCCYDDQNCTNDGCCDKPTFGCGADSCYDPDVEICCHARGTTCDIGYECQVSDGCCRIGRTECGDDHCYDPEERICCPEDGTTCSVRFTCEPTLCCRDGLTQCGEECYDADSEVCCGTGEDAEICDSEERCDSSGRCTATTTSRSATTRTTSTASSTVMENDSIPTSPTLGDDVDDNDDDDEDNDNDDDDDDVEDTATSTLVSGDEPTNTGSPEVTPSDAATKDILNGWQFSVPLAALIWRLI
ncbi:hypothetical protein BJX70DRAFT_404253 [Aspergillus crustosus]